MKPDFECGHCHGMTPEFYWSGSCPVCLRDLCDNCKPEVQWCPNGPRPQMHRAVPRHSTAAASQPDRQVSRLVDWHRSWRGWWRARLAATAPTAGIRRALELALWPFLALMLALMLALLEVLMFGWYRLVRLPLAMFAESMGLETFLRWVLPLSWALAAAGLGGRREPTLNTGAAVIAGAVLAVTLELGAGLYANLFDFATPATWLLCGASLGGGLAVTGTKAWSLGHALCWSVAMGLTGWALAPASVTDLQEGVVVLLHAFVPWLTPFVGRDAVRPAWPLS